MRIGYLIEKDPTYLQALLNKKTREDLFKIRKINDGKISSNIFDTKTAKNLPNSKDENEETKRKALEPVKRPGRIHDPKNTEYRIVAKKSALHNALLKALRDNPKL